MRLYAIGDLHLAGSQNKTMDKFGEKWHNHWQIIKENWISMIDEDDYVLIPGDISWALKLEDAVEDLNDISLLPGKKILLRGNHDYWWSSYNKVKSVLTKNMFALQNNSFIINDTAICGTRGWLCPNEKNFSKDDEKIYNRELLRLRLSVDSLKNKDYKKLIVMLHYPPFNDSLEDSGFTEIIKEYNAYKVVYAHLHGYRQKEKYDFMKDGITYDLTSCDFLNFIPKFICEL